MKQRLIISCVMSLLLVAVAYGKIASVMTNELDEAADYGSFTVLPNATADNPSVTVSDLGGDPNEVLIQTLITSAGNVSYSIMSSATCNPAASGGIGAVSWSTEIRKQAGGSAGDTPLCPVLEQDGKLYVYVGGGISGGDLAPDFFRETTETYSTVGFKGAIESDFESYDLSGASGIPILTNNGDNPDFSWEGSAIIFGYIAFSGTSSTGYDRRTAIRNGIITVDGFSVTTAYGNGADTQTSEYQKDVNAGTATSMGARWAPYTPRNSQIVLRFDLSQINKATITNASLELIKYRDYEKSHMDLYGVIDGKPGDALMDWTETGLTYSNALWIAQDETFDDTDLIASSVVKLDEAFPVAGDSGDVVSSQSTALLDFLKSDKNGVVTFIFTREDMIETGVELFASKEATDLQDSGGSGAAGTFAPKLVLGVEYRPAGTLVLIH